MDRLLPKPGDENLESPPSGVQISLMGAAPSISTGAHWSKCIVIDPRPDPEPATSTE